MAIGRRRKKERKKERRKRNKNKNIGIQKLLAGCTHIAKPNF
jgi:hypothetical protein